MIDDLSQLHLNIYFRQLLPQYISMKPVGSREAISSVKICCADYLFFQVDVATALTNFNKPLGGLINKVVL